ncbi:SRPBCC family protein [Streptomyces sp. NPDC012769]|uniref:SRPBCC family protein n=1 Tax=Streptomyces sp. NPDC012769 TaxID=3364848 RepID=UPI0036BDDF3E
MEHEVFVPVPAEVLRATLTDPARVARCVPGFQQDVDEAGAPAPKGLGDGPPTGRLKVRVGGHTITYRGSLRIAEKDGRFAVEGEGTEVRGKGTAALTLTVALTPVAEGTTLGFTGEVAATGRLAETDTEARAAAGARLLDRFAEALVAVADVEAEMAAEAREAEAETEAASDDDGVDDGVDEPGRPSVFDTPVPPPSLDPLADESFDAAAEPLDGPLDAPLDGPVDGSVGGPLGAGEDEDDAGLRRGGPPAEAAHARRTMIGRSAEEVDHAPPRGRYAPVPAAETSSATATLRWIAPAAALAIASAVVVGRALRRRR